MIIGISASDSLYKDGLHLTDKGKAFLADNFIVFSNNVFFRSAHTLSTKRKLGSNFKQTAELVQMVAELHLLQEERRKYLNNPLICYSNINCVRNKIADLRIITQSLPLDYFVLSETKLDESFQNARLNLDDYEIQAR